MKIAKKRLDLFVHGIILIICVIAFTVASIKCICRYFIFETSVNHELER